MSDHAAGDEWHTDWEEGICVYEDENGNWIVDKKVHRHPEGTEYTEVFKDEV